MALILLLIANISIFSIPYLINIKKQPNPFHFAFVKEEKLTNKIKFLYSKKSSDPFKINVEYTVLVIVSMLLESKGYIFNNLAAFFGTLSFVIVTYTGVFLYVFRRSPILVSDINFAKVGLTLLKGKKYIVIFFTSGLIILVYYLLYLITIQITTNESDKIYLYMLLFITGVLGFYNVPKYTYTSFYDRTFYSSIAHLYRNINEGKKYNYLLRKDEMFFKSFNQYENVELLDKPNVFIFSVESYGSIVLKDIDFKDEIIACLNLQRNVLDNNGYQAVSTFSESPLFGGGSWLCYSSFLYGTNIKDDLLHKIMMKYSSAFRSYQSLPGYLKTQGYDHYLLTPMGGGFKHLVDWDLIKNNHNTENFIDFESLEYKGQLNSFMELGVSAPDQYSLCKAHKMIKEKRKGPYSLFFNTLNSHTPFHSPRDVEEDWQKLDSAGYEYRNTNSANLKAKEKYSYAIQYQIKFIVDFITKNEDTNSVYILIGDHQPPFITDPKMGLDTMVHIISQNKTFLQGFIESGFSSGMIPKISDKFHFKHEGLYSLFMKSMNRAFGRDENLELKYFKDGINFKP